MRHTQETLFAIVRTVYCTPYGGLGGNKAQVLDRWEACGNHFLKVRFVGMETDNVLVRTFRVEELMPLMYDTPDECHLIGR